jgi:hypothetical protein
MKFATNFVVINEHLDSFLHILENVKMTFQCEKTQPKLFKLFLEKKIWPLNKFGEFELDCTKV